MPLDKETILKGEITGIASFAGSKQKCPECGRETDENFCAVHAEVKPVKEFSMAVNIDGEKVKLEEDHFNKLTGVASEQVESLPANDKMEFLKRKLRGTEVRVIGSKSRDGFYATELDVLSDRK